ncbi:hypothetical protein TNCV_2332031 [Trichonephila clavipes]|nr:hypothetical protein TNCV_2332031 [Trichonephila clavipes]
MPNRSAWPDRGPRNSSWQRAKRRLSLTEALRTIQVTVRFDTFPYKFRGRTPGVVRGLPPTSREDLRLDGYV